MASSLALVSGVEAGGEITFEDIGELFKDFVGFTGGLGKVKAKEDRGIQRNATKSRRGGGRCAHQTIRTLVMRKWWNQDKGQTNTSSHQRYKHHPGLS